MYPRSRFENDDAFTEMLLEIQENQGAIWEDKSGRGRPPESASRHDRRGSAQRSGTSGKRSWSNAFLHPVEVGTIRHGTAVANSQKT